MKPTVQDVLARANTIRARHKHRLALNVIIRRLDKEFPDARDQIRSALRVTTRRVQTAIDQHEKCAEEAKHSINMCSPFHGPPLCYKQNIPELPPEPEPPAPTPKPKPQVRPKPKPPEPPVVLDFGSPVRVMGRFGQWEGVYRGKSATPGKCVVLPTTPGLSTEAVEVKADLVRALRP